MRRPDFLSPSFLPRKLPRKSVLAASLIVALSGCAVGPDYQRPEAALPEQFKTSPESVPAVALDEQAAQEVLRIRPMEGAQP